MKKIFTLAITAELAVMATVSCSSLMEKDVELKDRQVQFKTNISSFVTKADTGFEQGDAVGIIAMEPINVLNVKYSVNGNKLVSDTPICWLEGQTEETEFMAYYPYDSEFDITNEYAYNIKVHTDQSKPENYHASDFLVAEKDAGPGETVKLEFYHLLSRIDFTVTGELEGKVASLALSGVASTINVGSGDYVGDPATIKAAEITDKNGKKAWSVIIVPQEVSPTIVITTTSGEQKSFNLGKTVAFQSSKRYTAEVSLAADGSLQAELVFRIFDWQGGDWVGFDVYRESWAICGNFNDWNQNWAYEMYRESRGLYTATLDLPEGAEFKFILNNSWETNLGAAVFGSDGEFRSDPLSVPVNVDLDYGDNGANLYLEQGGRVKVILNTIEKTATIIPGYTWVVENWNTGATTDMQYAGEGLRYVAERVYIPAGAVFGFRNDNWQFMLSPYPTMGQDGNPSVMVGDRYVKQIVSGETLELTSGGGEIWPFYFAEGGFVDVTLDLEQCTAVITLCQNQGMTVADVYGSMPEGTPVTLESVVYAVSARGFIVSDDGLTGLLIYTGNGTQPAVGDKVTITGKKQIYDQMPEVSDAKFTVISSGNQLAKVNYKDYSWVWGTCPSVSIPISVTGMLYVTPGSSETCTVSSYEGVYRLSYPTEKYLDYSGSVVTVTGWHTGCRGENFYNIVIDSIDGLKKLDHGSGTLQDPFDALGVLFYARESIANGSTSEEPVYVKGIVSSVTEQYAYATGRGTFFVAQNRYDGEFWRYNYDFGAYMRVVGANFLENQPWQMGNSQINAGDQAVVYAKITNQGGYPMVKDGDGFLYSLNGVTHEDVVPVEMTGDGTESNPFNVAAAIAFTQTLDSEISSENEVYIKGKVSQIADGFSESHGAMFFISDSGEPGLEFFAYRVNYLQNTSWNSNCPQINEGDEVVLCSRVMNYKGVEYRTVPNEGYVYSHNGETVPQEPDANEWFVTGSIQNLGWEEDIQMYPCYKNGGLYALIYYREGDEFKLRADHKWKVNRGIDGGSGLGGNRGVQNGDNITLPHEGVYEIFFYPNDDDFIYIVEYEDSRSWGITGTLEGLDWNADHIVSFTQADENLNPVIVFTDVMYNQGEMFKIRFQHDWFLNFGYDAQWTEDGSTVLEPGNKYLLSQDSSNMSLSQSGRYSIYFTMRPSKLPTICAVLEEETVPEPEKDYSMSVSIGPAVNYTRPIQLSAGADVAEVRYAYYDRKIDNDDEAYNLSYQLSTASAQYYTLTDFYQDNSGARLANMEYIAREGDYHTLVLAIMDKDGNWQGWYYWWFYLDVQPQGETWTSLGTGVYTDDFISSLYNAQSLTWEVEVQQCDQNPSKIRMVYPYDGKYEYNDPGDWDTTRSYDIEIVIADDSHVYILPQEIGINWGYGMTTIASAAGLYMSNGNAMVDIGDDYFGTLSDGIITFPTKLLRITMEDYYFKGWFNANNNSAFKLVLPGYTDGTQPSGAPAKVSRKSLKITL